METWGFLFRSAVTTSIVGGVVYGYLWIDNMVNEQDYGSWLDEE